MPQSWSKNYCYKKHPLGKRSWSWEKDQVGGALLPDRLFLKPEFFYQDIQHSTSFLLGKMFQSGDKG